MFLNKFDMNAAGFIPAILAGVDTDPSIPASQNPSATPPTRSGRNHDSELRELVHRLELVRAALMMRCDDFEGERSRALNVVNQAIKDVSLAIESNCGWSRQLIQPKEVSGYNLDFSPYFPKIARQACAALLLEKSSVKQTVMQARLSRTL